MLNDSTKVNSDNARAAPQDKAEMERERLANDRKKKAQNYESQITRKESSYTNIIYKKYKGLKAKETIEQGENKLGS